MHSRIFEISKQPLEKEDYRIFDYEDMDCLPPSVDYIVETISEEEDIKCLLEEISLSSERISITGNEIIFHEGYRSEYFKTRHQDLKRLVNELNLEEFSQESGYGMKNYEIKRIIDDSLSFRTYSEDNGHQSLDEFIRTLDYDTPYYICGIGDFHF